MAHVLAQTRLNTLFDDRMATGGGLAAVAACGLLTALLVHAVALATDDEPPDDLSFVPGMVMALGTPDAASITSPSVAQPTEPAEPTSTESAVTEDVTPPAPPRPSKPRPPSSRPSSTLPPKPSVPSLPRAPSKGDPFGDPRGFDERQRNADAWARGVIAALNGMDVGTVYGKPIVGSVRFEMTICKDGRVSRVSRKGGSATGDDRDRVLHEVERLQIPRPPAEVAATMKSHCVKLRHTFNWSVTGTR